MPHGIKTKTFINNYNFSIKYYNINIKNYIKMIINNSNEIKTLSYLYKNYSLKFNAEMLSKELKMPLSSIYSSLNILKKEKFVTPVKPNHNLFKLNSNFLPAIRFREFLDACKFSNFPEKVQEQISDVLLKIRLFHNEVLFLVLFGSYASGEFTQDSDIDMLLVRKDDSKEIQKELEYRGHLIQYTKSEFNNLFLEGDDFILSILLNHIIMHDPHLEFHSYLTKEMPKVSGKVIQEREQQLEKQRKVYLSCYKQNLPEEFIKNIILFNLMTKRLQYLKKGIILTTNNDVLRKIHRDNPTVYGLLLKLKEYAEKRKFPSMEKLREDVVAYAI